MTLTTLVYFTGLVSNHVSFDKKKFTLDENTIITSVYIAGEGIDNKLEYVDGLWEINSRYAIDNGMRDVFFAVLSQVEIRRPVPLTQKDSIADALKANGLKVTIQNNSELVKAYFVGGDEERFITYFIMDGDDDPYIMQIPGYLSFIAGIYDASENDWRDRFIWPVDWSRLKALKVVYENGAKKDLDFKYRDNFIAVVGVNTMDTSAVMDYLQGVANLQAYSFLEQENKYSEWAVPENKMIRIEIEQIANNNYKLDLYRIPDDENFYLGILNGTEGMLFQRPDIDILMKIKEDFILRE